MIDGIRVDPSLKPNDIKVRASILSVTDADGDTGLNYSYTPADINYIWRNKITGIILAPTQLDASFTDNGYKPVTVSASVPVITSSLSGAPAMGTTFVSSLPLTINPIIPPPPDPLAFFNGMKSSFDKHMPITGFVGATFQIDINGTDAVRNHDFTYKIDPPQSWVNVDNSGKITFTAKPPSQIAATVTIKISDKSGYYRVSDYTFTLKQWFSTETSDHWMVASLECTRKGATLPSPDKLTKGAGIRTSGTLFSEWGDMNAYTSVIDDIYNFYWASGYFDGHAYNTVDLSDGNIDHFDGNGYAGVTWYYGI